MKKTMLLFLVISICFSVFASTTWSGQNSSYLTVQISNGSLNYGKFDATKHVLSESVKNSSTYLVMYLDSIDELMFAELDSTGEIVVTMYPNYIRISSEDGKISNEYSIDSDYYFSEGVLCTKYSDMAVFLFRGLCSGNNMTIELISAVGEIRKYSVDKTGAFDYFFDWLDNAY